MTWFEVWAVLLERHRQGQTELAELDAAVLQAEGAVLIQAFSNGQERDAAVKANTAALKADAARSRAKLWHTKALLDYVSELCRSREPYREDLDPTR